MTRVGRKQILQDFRTRSLLESTRRLVALQGFDAVTMERVAREAGITKGGIYLYFRNKDEMIVTAIAEIASEMLRGIGQRTSPDAEPWEQLCQLIRAQMEIMERHKDLLRTLLLDRRLMKDSPGGEHARRLLKFRRRHEARIRAILERGIQRKVFCPVDTSRAAFYVNELTISTAQKRLLGLTRLSLKRETEGLIQFISLLLRQRKASNAR